MKAFPSRTRLAYANVENNPATDSDRFGFSAKPQRMPKVCGNKGRPYDLMCPRSTSVTTASKEWAEARAAEMMRTIFGP